MDFQYETWETRIRAYLHNEMIPSEKQQFEALMQQDPMLKEAVWFDGVLKQKAELTALTAYAHQNWDALNQSAAAKRAQKSWTRFIKFGFGLMLMIGLSWWGGSRYLAQQAVQNELTLHLQPLELRTDEFTADGNELLALKAYQQKQFEKAEQLFSQDDSPVKNQNAIRLYRAINGLCAKPPQTKKVIQILEGRYEQRNLYKFQGVEWYLFLGYVQQGRWEAALKVAKQIPKESVYFEQAQQFIPLIEKIK
ncbi:MAG: hypothetical protein RIS64_3472 [Bacteroidota bacterium]|jgi:hypothetical protein